MKPNLKYNEHAALDLVPLGRIGFDLYPDTFNASFAEVQNFSVSLGGSPGNVAIGAAKLGLRTGFIGRLCEDGIGQYLLRRVKEVGINTDGLVFDNSGPMTGLAFVEILSPTKCNTIMYRENAVDLALCPQDINEDYIANTKVLLVSGTALAKSPSREAALLALDYANTHGVVTALDIDYRPYSWQSPEETSIYLTLAAQKCQIILGNREEFDAIDFVHQKQGVELSNEQMAQHWFDHKAQLVIVKHGMEGSTAYLPSGQSHTSGVFEVEAKMTNGSGDAYAAGLLCQLIRGNSLPGAMTFGSATASLNLLGNDCSYAMPTYEQVESFLAERGVTLSTPQTVEDGGGI